jgi:beta-glucosidase
MDPDVAIKEAAEVAKSCEAAILVVGLNAEWEAESFDRQNMDLPLRLNDLVAAVLKAQPNTVVVIQAGTPVSLPWIDDCRSLLHTWYLGQLSFASSLQACDRSSQGMNLGTRLPISFSAM